MIPGWYSNNNHPFYEFFISEDGWCVTSSSSDEAVYLDKYHDLKNFTAVKSNKIISNESESLIRCIFKYGWKDSDLDEDYTGDFFK